MKKKIGKNILKKIYIGLFFTSLFSEIPLIGSICKFLDEILLFISFMIVVMYGLTMFIKNQVHGLIIFLIFYLIMQIVNFFASPFNLKLVYCILQALINIKLFIISLAFFILIKSCSLTEIRFLVKTVVGMFFIGYILNIVLGETWNSIFNIPPTFRYGILRPFGLWGNSAQLGYCFSLFFITLFWKKLKGTFKKSILLFSSTVIASFLLTVRKVLLLNFVYIFVELFRIKGYKKFVFISVSSILGGLMLIIFQKTGVLQQTLLNLKNMINPETSYIRGLMFLNGIYLFLKFFPFGVGSATFGTVLSKYNTFEVYEYVGLNITRIYSDGKLSGVYDSGVGSILAENGFIGIIFLGLFLYYYYKYFTKKIFFLDKKLYQILFFFTIFLFFSDPVWENGLYTTFYTISLAYVYSVQKAKLTKMKKQHSI